MEISSWFGCSEQSPISAFAKAQICLYRHNPEFQDYFPRLQLNLRRGSMVKDGYPMVPGRLYKSSVENGVSLARFGSKQRFKVDVLICTMPYFARESENQLLQRIIQGVAYTGATILCLIPAWAPCRPAILSWLEKEGRLNQVKLLDPASTLNRFSARLVPRAGRLRGMAAFGEIAEILKPEGMSPAPGSISQFIDTATHVEAWEYWEPRIEFGTVVTRCHWQTLCCAVCRTALRRGKPVITFQQGVIGHTLDVPVTATKYVSFGTSSADFLAKMNRSFFQSVGTTEPPVAFIPGGCLFDPILMLQSQFEKHTLLIIDEPVGVDDFYGIGPQREAIFSVSETLLSSSDKFRIVVRPHPHWESLGLDAWKKLMTKFPGRCELSHAAWTLAEDLRRASAVLGISSGALTVAAASGLPTFFMTTDAGFWTEDLACFCSGQTYYPDEALQHIIHVLTDERAYAEAREMSLRCAREYYHNGSQLELNEAFFKRLLGSK